MLFSLKFTPIFSKKVLVLRVGFKKCVWKQQKVHFLVLKSALLCTFNDSWPWRPHLVTARIGRVRRVST